MAGTKAGRGIADGEAGRVEAGDEDERFSANP
jgi:hypothetical protein